MPRSVAGLAGVLSVVLAENTGCAVVADGEVQCWGDNLGRQASPRGLLHSAQAVPVDMAKILWSEESL